MNEQLKQKIIENAKKKDFDEFTTNAILEFAEDFYAIFDETYMSQDELCKNIFDNLEGNIQLAREKNSDGGYHYKDGIIVLNPDHEKDYNRTLFHEFIHCMLRVKDKDGKPCGAGVQRIIDIGDGQKARVGKTIDEGIITIIEEKYDEYKKGQTQGKYVTNSVIETTKTINGYVIPVTYAKQLYFIQGEDFLRKYFNESREKGAECLVVDSIYEDVYHDEETAQRAILSYIDDTDIVLYRYEQIMDKEDIEMHDEYKQELDASNVAIESFVSRQAQASINYEGIETKEDLIEALEYQNAFSNLLFDKGTFMTEANIDKNIEVIEAVCKKNDMDITYLLEELESSFANNKNIKDKSYTLELLRNAREKAELQSMLELEDKNEVIRRIREDKEFFDKYSTYSINKVCEKVFEYSAEDVKDDEKYDAHSKHRALLHGLCSSSKETFDFEKLEYSLHYIEQPEEFGKRSKTLSQLDTLDKSLNRISKEPNRILSISEDNELVDIVYLERLSYMQEITNRATNRETLNNGGLEQELMDWYYDDEQEDIDAYKATKNEFIVQAQSLEGPLPYIALPHLSRYCLVGVVKDGEISVYHGKIADKEVNNIPATVTKQRAIERRNTIRENAESIQTHNDDDFEER